MPLGTPFKESGEAVRRKIALNVKCLSKKVRNVSKINFENIINRVKSLFTQDIQLVCSVGVFTKHSSFVSSSYGKL